MAEKKKRRPSKTSSIIGAFSDEDLNALFDRKFSDSPDPDKVSTDAVDAYLKAQAQKRNISAKKTKKTQNQKSSSSEEDAHLFAQLADLVAKTETSSTDKEKGLRESHVKELMGMARDTVRSKNPTVGSLTEDELNALFAGAELADPDESTTDMVEKYLNDLSYADEISSASRKFLEDEERERKNVKEPERKKKQSPASKSKPKSKPRKGAEERKAKRNINDEVSVNLPRHYHTHDFETDSFNLRRAIKEESQLKGLKERVHLDYHFYRACDQEAVEKFLKEEIGREAVPAITVEKKVETGKPKRKEAGKTEKKEGAGKPDKKKGETGKPKKKVDAGEPEKKGEVGKPKKQRIKEDTTSEEDIEEQIKELSAKAVEKIPDILPSTHDWVSWEKGKPRDLLGSDRSEEETKQMISKLEELILLSSDYQLTEELMAEDDEASTVSRQKIKRYVTESEKRRLKEKLSPEEQRHREDIMIDIRKKILPGKPTIKPKARERTEVKIMLQPKTHEESVMLDESSLHLEEKTVPRRKGIPEPKARMGLEGIPKEWIKQRDKQTVVVDRERKYGETLVVTARQHKTSTKAPTEEDKIVEKMTVTVQTHKEKDLIGKPALPKPEDISREKLREVIMEVEEKKLDKEEKAKIKELLEKRERRKLSEEALPQEVSPKEKFEEEKESSAVISLEKRGKYEPKRTKPEIPLRPSIEEQTKPVLDFERLLRQAHIVMQELALLSRARELKQEIYSMFSEEPTNKIAEELKRVEEMIHDLSDELHQPLPP